ncbi:deoxynucleoside monophosphate kinase [Pseudomonas phage PlaquesPlease]|uniref:Deoxynucleoside monophosphate kinase n=1 Tax=Pseudomonas phage PlaquesPlease TaxID=2762289 RepID=A0A7G8LJT0_9CAUD|nr:deoxynucleoside monophosphate kinase [Pseudomonas phage PlaquesPlease]
MTDKVIIALTSERGRSGKDTLVELLREEGYEIHRVAFGDVLKHACAIELTHGWAEQVVMESHMHTDLKDAAFDELAIENIPESGYKDWLWDVQGEVQDLDVCAPRSPRWHLQQYGTGYRRNHCKDPDVWLREGLKVIDKADGLVIVTDMRQANEYAALELRGAHLVRLSRDWSIEAVDTAPLHATDIELRDHRMDAVVVNRWGHASDMLDQLKAQGVIE